MAENNKHWIVDVIEYERGWGARHDFSKGFETEKEAKQWVENYNSVNNEPMVPDWYMAATEPYYSSEPFEE